VALQELTRSVKKPNGGWAKKGVISGNALGGRALAICLHNMDPITGRIELPDGQGGTYVTTRLINPPMPNGEQGGGGVQ
jgi:hypothetical protein